MRHYRNVVTTGRWFAASAIALLLSSGSSVACDGTWDLSGLWSISQDNGFTVTLDLVQKGHELYGSADFRNPEIDTHYFAQIDQGRFEGTSISFRVPWSAKDNFVGVYTGTIDSLGRIAGTTYQEQNRGLSAGWSGNRAANCIVAAAPPPPPPAPASPLDQAGILKKPGKGGEILKQTVPPASPAGPIPAGAEYATAISPATIYVEPGGAAFKDANGDDIGMPVGSKALVLEKRTDPVWYKLQTKPVGWVWGEDVTLGP